MPYKDKEVGRLKAIERKRRWRAENPDRVAAYAKAYYSEHKAAQNARTNAWHKVNKEHHRNLMRSWHASEKGKLSQKKTRQKRVISGKQAEAHRAYYLKNKDRIKQKDRAWTLSNPDKKTASKHRRRARKAQTETADCCKTIKLLKLIRLCHYCFRVISGTTSIDHIIPLSRGGSHTPSNLRATCSSCNLSKGSKLISEWRNRGLY